MINQDSANSSRSIVEKPFAYLDHNIYDFILKNPHSTLPGFLLNTYQVAYSAENLKEIARSPEYANEYLRLLKAIDALYMEIILDENMKCTDRVKFYQCDPFEMYHNQIEDTDDIPIPEIDCLYYKFMGGLDESSFDQIIDKKMSDFEGLQNYIIECQPNLDLYANNLKEQVKKDLEGLRSSLNNQVPAEIRTNMPEAFRAESGGGAQILNNIKGPNVIKQIWDKLSGIFGDVESIDSLLGFENEKLRSLVNPNNTLYQKTSGLYSFLEMIGYWSDRRLKKERRFKSFISDRTHISYAIFCSALFTRDQCMAMKAAAIYEYFGISTAIIQVHGTNE